MIGSPVADASVDDQGLLLPGSADGTGDVYFDDHRAWSFSVQRRRGQAVRVSWPPRMRRWLDGSSRVRVEVDGAVLFDGEVRFGSGAGRVEFTDAHGAPVVIDKWGLVQRPFEHRDRRVVEEMADRALHMIAVLRERCGIEAWIAFGSLLGAVRDGRVIGHDSDIDLAYLSDAATPAEMAVEMSRAGRALRAEGMTVENKSGAFLTVLFPVADGGTGSIDLYVCFHLCELLHETATVRAPVPRSAVLPLGTVRFEGRDFPAPADPDALLTASYGAGWRVPDPSFRYLTGPEITDRFDGWFGSLMRGRREWTAHYRDGENDDRAAQDFADWVLARVPAPVRVLEVGIGDGSVVTTLTAHGHDVVGLDYARPLLRRARRRLRAAGLDDDLRMTNLYDLRDVLTQGALLARGEPVRAVLARRLVEVLDDDGVEHAVRLVAMVLRRGGTLLLEGEAVDPGEARRRRQAGQPRVRPLDPSALVARLAAAGGVVVDRSGFAAARRALDGGAPARWRLVVEWRDPAAVEEGPR